MGIGDNIRKAADEAMKDLGDNSLPPDDGHTPQLGNEADDVRVHSSIIGASPPAREELGDQPSEEETNTQ